MNNHTPYTVFTNHLNVIEKFFTVSCLSYDSVESNVEVIPSDERNLLFESVKQSGAPCDSTISVQLSHELASLLFVKIISTLEVFLIDELKYVFSKSKGLFRSSTKVIEIPQAKLLTAHSLGELQWLVVEKDARKLHSGGFQDVAKYYNTQFKIDFAQMGIDIGKLEKYHDRRHLIVHRLGRIDGVYAHKYNEKAGFVRIDKAELMDCLGICRKLAEKIDAGLESLMLLEEQNRHKPEIFEAVAEIEVLALELPRQLSADHIETHRGRSVKVGSAITLTKIDEKNMKVHFKCMVEDYRVLRRMLSRLRKSYDIIITKVTVVSPYSSYSDCNLPTEYLATIAKTLPPRNNWFTGIHKELAIELGISNGKASDIISAITRNHDLMSQLGHSVCPRFIARL